MLLGLGLRRCAYDWRAEHVDSFEEEILQYKRHGIEFFAFWDAHPKAFELFKKHDLHPQIWKTAPSPEAGSQTERVAAAVNALKGLCKQTREIGCRLGLYNHGGWGGEPKNLVAVCERLRAAGHDHVGIVYNFHHGHNHISDWKASLAQMKPYLHCLNINGMNDDARPKIVPISQGKHERKMLRVVLESGYQGPIGILDHQPQRDAREVLAENLEGLGRIRSAFTGGKPLGSTVGEPSANESSGVSAPTADASISAMDAEQTAALIRDAQRKGDYRRGTRIFADHKSACISCHKIGQHGGTVGPDLSRVGKERPAEHIVESLFSPQRKVEPEFTVWQVVTTDGEVKSGYRLPDEGDSIRLRDPATGGVTKIARDEVDELVASGSLMPEGLMARLSDAQRLDVIHFLTRLGNDDQEFLRTTERILAMAASHRPEPFAYSREPLSPEDFPSWQHPVNRDRIYDFYTKQAEFFRLRPVRPMLLGEYPGLDGGMLGHWGNQTEETWADGRWNETDLGSLQCGIFRGDSVSVVRGVCLRLGDEGEMAVCFNPETLRYEAAWTGGFVRFSSVRHGFLDGLRMQGEAVSLPEQDSPQKPFQYHGYYRHGRRTVFAYRIGDVEYLDAPWIKDGRFVRQKAPVEVHSLRHLTTGGPAQWPKVIETRIVPGSGRPYAIDTIELPLENPWNALLFCGGHDFLPDGSAVVCTMQGDVWRVKSLDAPMDEVGVARWRRIASGLHHPLGLVVDNGEIFVLGRDQITRLHDLNHDGEMDYYECFSNAYETSPAGHDFICGLERDQQDRFYTASGNQGLVRISADGQVCNVLATGFRNPDGLCVMPDGLITVPCSEGSWTPASMICAVRPSVSNDDPPPHFGHGGPRDGKPPELPLAYLPRGLDNSSGGQTVVSSDRWGPLEGQLLHFSFGSGRFFLVLRDEVDGQLQGAVVPLPGEFRSGVHRGRFHPIDGQLYVSGMAGWGSYTTDDGCFQRVRYRGDSVQLPIGFHVHANGVVVQFSQPLEPAIAANPASHFAQCWNYRYSSAYGSAEYSTTHHGVPGHDPLEIRSAHVLADGKSMFLELPDLQPVNQLHLRLNVGENRGHDLFVTVHALDEPFTTFPGHTPWDKKIAPHPILSDLALATKRVPNPFAKPLNGARPIKLSTGKNLTFETRTIPVKAGEPLILTLVNPDVVPHNWALAKPGTLKDVGHLANRLVADPEAAARQYIPETDDVLAYTDVVPPGSKFTISFNAPKEPGRYPFLCTFPGHWMVMNGEMIVAAPSE